MSLFLVCVHTHCHMLLYTISILSPYAGRTCGYLPTLSILTLSIPILSIPNVDKVGIDKMGIDKVRINLHVCYEQILGVSNKVPMVSFPPPVFNDE